MRGDDQKLQAGMFSYVALEDRIAKDHPLRAIRKLVDQVLTGMSKQFDRLYSDVGRPSIPPERLLRALLLQVFYSIRSENLLMEQLDYNLLFRWFVGLEIDDRVWDATVYSKNRDRLLNQDVAQRFFEQVKRQAVGLMSDEHFTVDGTLIEAWAGQKSFQRKDKGDGGADGGKNFHGEQRRNDTHESKTSAFLLPEIRELLNPGDVITLRLWQELARGLSNSPNRVRQCSLDVEGALAAEPRRVLFFTARRQMAFPNDQRQGAMLSRLLAQIGTVSAVSCLNIL